MRNLRNTLALAAMLASAPADAQIKKVLVTDFIYGSTHTAGRPLCLAALKEIGLEVGFTVEVANAEGKITADYLEGFDAVVWNNMSQNGLQAAATKSVWQAWLEGGGALLALHASGDTRTGTWTWYMEGLLDAKYEGHSDVVPADVWIYPSAIAANGQFHPILKNQDKYFKQYTITGEAQKRWAQPWADEWYKFTKNPDPKGKDMIVLMELDEFNKRGVTSWDPAIAKTGYHPMAWARENIGAGKGRLVYLVTGHDDKILAAKDKGVKELWKNALVWSAKGSVGCKTPAASNYNAWVDKDDGTCLGVGIARPAPSRSGARPEAWVETLRGGVRDAIGRAVGGRR
jgi:hypothetical protein